MPVLLHQLPDGDTIGQQWAELPPVLGATQMVGAEGAEKKEKKRARRKAQRKESFAARRGQRSGCLSSGHPSISDLSDKSDLLSEMRSGHWSPFRFVESVAMPLPSEPKGTRTMKSRATGFCSTRSRRSPPPAIL